jgi:hypothetical protein
MTFISKTTDHLTAEEKSEMEAIREMLHFTPHAVHPDKMEKYTNYLVRSMRKMETVKKVA